MRQFNNYQVVIFDCDGVILDSNQLKIEAMEKAILSQDIDKNRTRVCLDYFKRNFGKSRFHHIDHFVNRLLDVAEPSKEVVYTKILNEYSRQCFELYLCSETTPGFVEFIEQLGDKQLFVASGSEEKELREVFIRKGLSDSFVGIFGSPTPKAELVANIISKTKESERTLMIGDAISDLNAARDNNIDFAYYSPFSNVDLEMRKLCKEYNYKIIDNYQNETGNN